MSDFIREMAALARKDFYSHKAKIVAVYAGNAAIVLIETGTRFHHMPAASLQNITMIIGILQMVVGYGIIVDNITMDCVWNRRGFLFLKPVDRSTLVVSKILLATAVGVLPVLVTILSEKGQAIFIEQAKFVLIPFLRVELLYAVIGCSAFLVMRAGEAIGIHLAGLILVASIGPRYVFSSRFGPESVALLLSLVVVWGAVFLTIHIRNRTWAALATAVATAGGAVGFWTWS